MICETMAGDNRIIEKAKEAILEGTNIDSSEDEMKVLDNFLFRCWQMGWLDKYDDTKTPTDTPTDLISRRDALDSIRHDPNDTYDAIKSLPLRLTEYKTFCGVPIEEAVRIMQEHNADKPTGDLISRQDAIDVVRSSLDGLSVIGDGDHYADCIVDGLEDISSAEPKTGKWVEVEKNEYEGFSIVNMRCNQCGRYAYLVLPKGTKCVYDYCPWCKADMRGEEE